MGEARSWVDQLLPTADSLDPQARAELLLTAAVTALEASDDAAALATRERLVPLLDELDDSYLQAVGELVNSWISFVVNDWDRAVQEASVSLEKLRAQDEPLWTAMALLSLGSLEAAVGTSATPTPPDRDARPGGAVRQDRLARRRLPGANRTPGTRARLARQRAGRCSTRPSI